MLKIVAILVLVAVCMADPPRPKIPETFSMMGDAEDHATNPNKTYFGRMFIGEDATKQMRVQNYTFDERKVNFEDLELFMAGEDYKILRSEGTVKCTSSKITGKFYSFFEWLELAKYAGTRTVRHVVYDLWVADIAAAHFRAELGVRQDDPNMPAFFNYMIGGDRPNDLRMLIMDFRGDAPSSADFAIPSSCTKPRKTRLY